MQVIIRVMLASEAVLSVGWLGGRQRRMAGWMAPVVVV